MKTLKSILIVTAASAALFTLNAAPSLQSPRAAAIKPASVSTGVTDQNLIETPQGNARAQVGAKTSAAAEDPNLLACAKKGKATCSNKPCCVAKDATCKK